MMFNDYESTEMRFFDIDISKDNIQNIFDRDILTLMFSETPSSFGNMSILHGNEISNMLSKCIKLRFGNKYTKNLFLTGNLKKYSHNIYCLEFMNNSLLSDSKYLKKLMSEKKLSYHQCKEVVEGFLTNHVLNIVNTIQEDQAYWKVGFCANGLMFYSVNQNFFANKVPLDLNKIEDFSDIVCIIHNNKGYFDLYSAKHVFPNIASKFAKPIAFGGSILLIIFGVAHYQKSSQKDKKQTTDKSAVDEDKTTKEISASNANKIENKEVSPSF